MMYCNICGDELEPEEEEEGICWNCQSAILQEDGIDMGVGDEELF